jgi:hypothetical protein
MQSHKEKSGPFGAGVNNSKYFGARLSAGDGRGNKLEKFKSFNVDGYIKGKNGVTFDNSEQSIIIITDDFLQRVSLESTSLNPLGKCKHDFIGEIHSVQPWSFEQDRLTSDDYEDAFAKRICVQYGEDLKVAYFSSPPLYNNCSEIYSITHEYPVVRSVFKVSPMVSGGMLLVSSPIEFIYLLTFSKFRSDCKMHKIITLPSGIRKINKGV